MKLAIGTISFFTNDALFDLFKRSLATVHTCADHVLLNAINHPVTPEQQQYLNDSFDWVYTNERNNVSMAWNKMIDYAIEQGCDRLLITNSDMFYEMGAIDKVLDYSINTGVFITGASLFDDINFTQRVTHGTLVHYASFMINLQRWAEWQDKDPDKKLQGYFNYELFDPAYYEDIDFDRRVKLTNMGVSICQDARCQHLVSQSIRLDPETANFILNKAYAKCRINYATRWGGDIGEEKYLVPNDV